MISEFKKVNKGSQQTAKAIMLQQSFASHPSRGITPASLSDIFEEAETGNLILQSELFMDIEERDSHIHAELSKRKRTIIGLPKIIHPPKNPTTQEVETVDKLNNIINQLYDFDDMLLDLLDGIGHGFSCVELEWGNVDGVWMPVQFYHRPQSWFQLDTETRSILRLRDQSVHGVDLWPYGWIVHKHFAKSGYLSRSGLFRILAWPWLMKQFSLNDLAEYLEIYGFPIKIGKFPRSISEDERDDFERAIRQLGRAVTGIIPDDMSLDLLKESLGSADPFMAMVRYCDDAISRAVLGQTLSSSATSTGLGSGVASLHGDVRQDLLEADAAQLSSTITKQLIKPLLEINGWNTGRNFIFEFDTSSPADLNSFADSIQKLASTGVKISQEWIRKTAKIPEPLEEDTVIGSDTPLPVADTLVNSTIAAAKVAALSSGVNQNISTYPDKQVNRLDDDVSPVIDAMLSRVRSMLKESSSLEEFDNKVLAWFPEAQALDMTELLTNAFAASELAGRYETSQNA